MASHQTKCARYAFRAANELVGKAPRGRGRKLNKQSTAFRLWQRRHAKMWDTAYHHCMQTE